MKSKEYRHKGIHGCRCRFCYGGLMKKKPLNKTRLYIKKDTQREIKENKL